MADIAVGLADLIGGGMSDELGFVFIPPDKQIESIIRNCKLQHRANDRDRPLQFTFAPRWRQTGFINVNLHVTELDILQKVSNTHSKKKNKKSKPRYNIRSLAGSGKGRGVC